MSKIVKYSLTVLYKIKYSHISNFGFRSHVPEAQRQPAGAPNPHVGPGVITTSSPFVCAPTAIFAAVALLNAKVALIMPSGERILFSIKCS